MKINIIGENSSNRMKLLKNLNKVTKNEDINVEINVIDDKETLSKYKDKNKPILMINEKIISNGKILTDREIRNFDKASYEFVLKNFIIMIIFIIFFLILNSLVTRFKRKVN